MGPNHLVDCSMVDVPEHLVPTDVLVDSTIRLAGFDVVGSGATVRFEMVDIDGEPSGDLAIDVEPQPDGTIDAMIAEAHRKLCDVLRQWLYVIDKERQAYDRQLLR